MRIRADLELIDDTERSIHLKIDLPYSKTVERHVDLDLVEASSHEQVRRKLRSLRTRARALGSLDDRRKRITYRQEALAVGRVRPGYRGQSILARSERYGQS